MLGLLGALGGAAAIEIRKMRRKDDQVQLLKEKEYHLRLLLEQKDQELQEERQLKTEVEAQMQQLSIAATASQEEMESLKHQKLSLEEQAQELSRANEDMQKMSAVNAAVMLYQQNLLLNSKSELQRELDELALERQRLCKEIEELQHREQETTARFGDDLAALKGQVSDILTRLLGNDISEEQAVRDMKALGCEIEFVPAPDTHRSKHMIADQEWGAGNTYVMDSPMKMQRLMSAMMTPRIMGAQTDDKELARLAQMSFPNIKDPAATPRFTLSWLQDKHGEASSSTPRVLLSAAGEPSSGANAIVSAAAEAAASRTGNPPALTDTASDVIKSGRDDTDTVAKPMGVTGDHLTFSPDRKAKKKQSSGMGFRLAGNSFFGGVAAKKDKMSDNLLQQMPTDDFIPAGRDLATR
eukprot:jgi/Chrzof1/14600/Cz09g09010.t1